MPFSRLVLHPDRLDQPLHWRKPRVVLVASRGDLLHDEVPNHFLDEVWSVMVSPHGRRHTYLILTKRPHRLRSYLGVRCNLRGAVPALNVWLGVSVTCQAEADERIPILLDTPAVARWVSYEPALAAVDFRPYIGRFDGLSAIIAGCESGPGRRPARGEWFDDVHAQCRDAKVPLYLKQTAGKVGGSTDGTGRVIRFLPQSGELPWALRGQGGVMAECPFGTAKVTSSGDTLVVCNEAGKAAMCMAGTRGPNAGPPIVCNPDRYWDECVFYQHSHKAVLEASDG